MSGDALWDEKLYREIVFYTLLFLVLISGVALAAVKKDKKYTSAWASLKSWIFTMPVILLVAGLPAPWPLLALVLISIYGAKSLFMMTGMYHRSWFVWITYAFICASGYTIYKGYDNLFNLMPMFALGSIFMIPILRNSAKQMIQYTALSAIAYLFLGWCFLHLGRLLNLENGMYILLYVFILSEFCEGISLAVNRFAKIKPFSNISPKVSIEGVLVSTFLTVLLAWVGRGLLPETTESFWLATGLIVALFGRFGGLVFSVIRKDLGIKDTGVFIIGRNDILSRIDKPVFVAPLVYYVLLYLQGQFQL